MPKSLERIVRKLNLKQKRGIFRFPREVWDDPLVKHWIEQLRHTTKKPPLVVLEETYYRTGVAAKLKGSRTLVTPKLWHSGLLRPQGRNSYVGDIRAPVSTQSLVQTLSGALEIPMESIGISEQYFRETSFLRRRPRSKVKILSNAYNGALWFEVFKRVLRKSVQEHGLPKVMAWEYLVRSGLKGEYGISPNKALMLSRKGFLIPSKGSKFRRRRFHNIINNEAFAQLYALVLDVPFDAVYQRGDVNPYVEELSEVFARERIMPFIESHHIDPDEEYTMVEMEKLTRLRKRAVYVATIHGSIKNTSYRGRKTRIRGIDGIIYALKNSAKTRFTEQDVQQLFGVDKLDTRKLRMEPSREGTFSRCHHVFRVFDEVAREARKKMIGNVRVNKEGWSKERDAYVAELSDAFLNNKLLPYVLERNIDPLRWYNLKQASNISDLRRMLLHTSAGRGLLPTRREEYIEVRGADLAVYALRMTTLSGMSREDTTRLFGTEVDFVRAGVCSNTRHSFSRNHYVLPLFDEISATAIESLEQRTDIAVSFREQVRFLEKKAEEYLDELTAIFLDERIKPFCIERRIGPTRYYSASEAAFLSGVNQHTLSNSMHKGRVPQKENKRGRPVAKGIDVALYALQRSKQESFSIEEITDMLGVEVDFERLNLGAQANGCYSRNGYMLQLYAKIAARVRKHIRKAGKSFRRAIAAKQAEYEKEKKAYVGELIEPFTDNTMLPFMIAKNILPSRDYLTAEASSLTDIGRHTLVSAIHKGVLQGVQEDGMYWSIKGIDLALYAVRMKLKDSLTTEEVRQLFGADVDFRRLGVSSEKKERYGRVHFILPLYDKVASLAKKKLMPDASQRIEKYLTELTTIFLDNTLKPFCVEREINPTQYYSVSKAAFLSGVKEDTLSNAMLKGRVPQKENKRGRPMVKGIDVALYALQRSQGDDFYGEEITDMLRIEVDFETLGLDTPENQTYSQNGYALPFYAKIAARARKHIRKAEKSFTRAIVAKRAEFKKQREAYVSELVDAFTNNTLLPFMIATNILPSRDYSTTEASSLTDIGGNTFVYAIHSDLLQGVQEDGIHWSIKGIDLALYAVRRKLQDSLTTEEVRQLFGADVYFRRLGVWLDERETYGRGHHILPFYDRVAKRARRYVLKDAELRFYRLLGIGSLVYLTNQGMQAYCREYGISRFDQDAMNHLRRQTDDIKNFGLEMMETPNLEVMLNRRFIVDVRRKPSTLVSYPPASTT